MQQDRRFCPFLTKYGVSRHSHKVSPTPNFRVSVHWEHRRYVRTDGRTWRRQRSFSRLRTHIKRAFINVERLPPVGKKIKTWVCEWTEGKCCWASAVSRGTLQQNWDSSSGHLERFAKLLSRVRRNRLARCQDWPLAEGCHFENFLWITGRIIDALSIHPSECGLQPSAVTTSGPQEWARYFRARGFVLFCHALTVCGIGGWLSGF